MRPPGWLDKLQCLAARFSESGVNPDLVALSAAEAWGLYRFLRQVAEG